MDNGISCIAYNSSLKLISPTEQENAGYAAVLHKQKLYIGTSGGVYSTPVLNTKDISFNTSTFTEVANTTGQAWNLTEINGKLLLGHHEGAFEIQDNTAFPFASGVGFWNFIPTTSAFPCENIVAGNYKGLQKLRFDGHSFFVNGNLPGFDESSRFVAVDMQKNYWVSHPYHGIYRLFKNQTAVMACSYMMLKKDCLTC